MIWISQWEDEKGPSRARGSMAVLTSSNKRKINLYRKINLSRKIKLSRKLRLDSVRDATVKCPSCRYQTPISEYCAGEAFIDWDKFAGLWLSLFQIIFDD